MLRKTLIVFMLAILLVGGVSAMSASRSFSDSTIAPSEKIQVSIIVSATGASVYGVEENVPAGWAISNINEAGGLVGNKISWLFLDNTDRILTYDATAPGASGTYTFGGQYTDGSSTFTIGGQTQVSVSGGLIPSIKINEFESNPAGDDSGNEWVELYNPTGSSVDVSGWKLINDDSDERVITGTISAGGDLVIALPGLWLDNTNERVILKTSSNTLVDQTPLENDGDNDVKSWQRIPNGVDNWQFEPATKGAQNTEGVTPGPQEGDDLMVNYVRGKITVDGANARFGLAYQVEVLSGENLGYVYYGTVDGNIPTSPVNLTGNGYYDTLDNVKFSTGANFKVSLVDYPFCNATGTFTNGGNGLFVPTSNLVNIVCVLPNYAPEFDEVTNKVVAEGSLLQFIVSATDINNDALTYFANFLPIGAVFDALSRTFSWTPDYNQSGAYDVQFVVSDGEFNDTTNVTITVNNTNRNPVLEAIPDQTVDEDVLGGVLVNATDLDGEALTYSISNENVSKVNCEAVGNNITFISAGNWSGNATCTVKVRDILGGSDEKSFNIIVSPVNDAPILNNIPNIVVGERELITILATAIDVDGDSLTYTINDTQFTNNGNGNFTWQTDFDDEGMFYVEVNVTDGSETDTQNVKVTVNPNTAPTITSHSPSDNPKITENGSQNFSIAWQDENNPGDVQIKWFVDGIEKASGTNSYTFTGNGTSKDYTISVEVYDGEFTVSHEWTLTTSNIPLTEKYNGDTTDFTGMNDTTLSLLYLILEKIPFGKIEFLTPVDMRNVVDLDSHSDIQNGLAGIDTNVFGTLKNSRARVSFSGLNFNKTPTIYYNSGYTLNPSTITAVCPSTKCSNVEYNSGTLTFEVDSFSTFMVGDTLTCSQQGGNICGDNRVCSGELIEARDSDSCCSAECVPKFSDVKVCKSLNSDVRITIKNPDEGDEFYPGEDINVEVQIENNLEEDLSFDVEAHLYNLDRESSEEDTDESSFDVDSGERETLDLTLTIPEDLDEDDEYAVFVKVVDEDNESYCNQQYVEIDIQREKHSVVIQSNDLLSEVVYPGEEIGAKVNVQNVGTKDEDATIKISVSRLNLSAESDEFEIEKYDDKDTVNRELYLDIPEDAEEGEYELITTVYFENGKGKDSETQTFKIIKNEPAIYDTKSLTPTINLGGKNNTIALKTATTSGGLSGIFHNSSTTEKLIMLLLIAGAIALIITLVLRRRA